jgi:hypothetical protein
MLFLKLDFTACYSINHRCNLSLIKPVPIPFQPSYQTEGKGNSCVLKVYLHESRSLLIPFRKGFYRLFLFLDKLIKIDFNKF